MIVMTGPHADCGARPSICPPPVRDSKGATPAHPSPVATTCTYQLAVSETEFDAQSRRLTVSVATAPGCNWSASTDVDWLHIAGPATGAGPGDVTVECDQNTGEGSRQGAVIVSGTACALRQSAAPCSIVFHPDSLQFPAQGGAASVSLTTRADCAWRVECDATWVSLQSPREGEGSVDLSITVAPHTGPVLRGTTLRAGSAAVAIGQQPPVVCTVSVSPTSETFDSTGGAGRLEVKAPEGCRWAAGSRESWIRVTAPRNGEGIGSQRLEYEVEANPQTTTRNGTLQIGDAQVAVEQRGARTCDYAVAPTAFDLPFYGCTECRVAITATPGCGWTAASGADWITLTGPTQGAGEATVLFRADAHTGLTVRKGPILIRWPSPSQGQNVWVTQTGCSYILTPNRVDIGAAATTGTVKVFAGPQSSATMRDCPWKTESDAAWLRVTSATGSGEGFVRFTVAENSDRLSREGHIRVEHATFTVVQAGRP